MKKTGSLITLILGMSLTITLLVVLGILNSTVVAAPDGGVGGTDMPLQDQFITVTAAGDIWYSGGPFGGYINSLALAATNPEMIFAGTVSGVFKSTNSGVQWVKTGHPDIEVYSVVVTADNANIVYSGTTKGIYKSTDGGATWQPHGLSELSVRSLAIDPRNPAILFAGADDIYKSDNFGETWVLKKLLPIYTFCNILLVDSDDSRFVYAAINSWGYFDDGLLKSIDAGETWESRHVASDVDNSEGVFTLAMTPAGAASPAMYAFSVDLETDVYKSIDRGESWTHCNIPGDWWMVSNPPVALTVDPNNPNRIYLGVGEYSGEFYSSPDAGATWQKKMNGLPEGKFASILVDPRNGNILIGIQNGGIYRSTNAVDSWVYSSSGLLNTEIVGLSIDPTNSATGFAAIRGRGHRLAKTTDQGVSWTVMPRITSGYIPTIQAELGALTYDPQNPNIVYIGDGWEYANDLYIYKTMNGGESWEKLIFMNGGQFYWEPHGVADIWVHPQDSNTLLLAVSGWGGDYNAGGVYRSINGGYAWTRPLKSWVSSLAADPNNPNIVYAGTKQCGYVYRSENAGIGWTNISPSAPPGECWVWAVNDLEVDTDGSLFTATSGGLMKWDGHAWTQLIGSPGVGNALTVDRTTLPSTVYIGTYSGVFFSQDSGSIWTSINEGLATLSITKLMLASSPRKILYAGTEYSGVWVRELAGSDSHKLFLPLVIRQLAVIK